MTDEEWLPFDVATNLLSASEQETADKLATRMNEGWPFLRERALYYDGTQRMRHLGISVPPELEHRLKAAAGWPRVIVDAIRYKLKVAGFRLPGSLDADSGMWDVWTANKMRSKASMAHLAALKYGRAFLVAGSGGPAGMPLVTAESPTSMAAEFDGASHRVTAALQRYRFFGAEAMALYVQGSTIHLVRPEGGEWQVRERDDHGLDVVPVTMLANRGELEDLYGTSEITPEVMSLTDAACRALLRMDIGSEFFSSPQRWIIGAAMSNFVDVDGDPISAWETYIGRLLALERDEEGNVPSVGQFPAASPQPHVDVLQFLARLMSAVSRVPPHRFGLSTDNPVSAEAIQASDAELDELACGKQETFEDPWAQLMQHALMIQNNGTLPDGARQLEVMWASPSTPAPAVISAAMAAQVTAGLIPATSQVALERLGYTPVERQRIEAERKRAEGQQALQQIAASLQQRQQPQLDAARQAEGEPGGGGQPAPGDNVSA